MSKTTREMLHDHVHSYANEQLGAWLEDTGDECPMFDDVLEVDLLCSLDREVKEVRLLVTFGGPNIWVHINRYGDARVEGYWGSESCKIKSPHDMTPVFQYWDEAFF